VAWIFRSDLCMYEYTVRCGMFVGHLGEYVFGKTCMRPLMPLPGSGYHLASIVQAQTRSRIERTGRTQQRVCGRGPGWPHPARHSACCQVCKGWPHAGPLGCSYCVVRVLNQIPTLALRGKESVGTFLPYLRCVLVLSTLPY
jgi:hypothetical protein